MTASVALFANGSTVRTHDMRPRMTYYRGMWWRTHTTLTISSSGTSDYQNTNLFRSLYVTRAMNWWYGDDYRAYFNHDEKGTNYPRPMPQDVTHIYVGDNRYEVAR